MARSNKFRIGNISLVLLGLLALAGIANQGDTSTPPQSRQAGTEVFEASSQTMGAYVAPHVRFVDTDTLNVRATPETSARVMLKLSRGAAVTIVRKSGPWYALELSDGSVGWLHGDYLAEQRTSSERTPASTVPLAVLAQSRNCHPSYVGKCLPIGRDVDCPDIGGSVSVVGPDVYRLDRDRDGIGCE